MNMATTSRYFARPCKAESGCGSDTSHWPAPPTYSFEPTAPDSAPIPLDNDGTAETHLGPLGVDGLSERIDSLLAT